MSGVLPESYISDHRDSIYICAEVMETFALSAFTKRQNNIFFRWALNVEIEYCLKCELGAFQSCKQVFFYSEDEANWYKSVSGCSNGSNVSIGLDLDKYIPITRSNNRPFKIIFYGNYSWHPNNDGLRYLLEDIWPYISSRRSDVHLEIAGRNLPKWTRKFLSYKSLSFVGEVSNIGDFISHADIVLSPIRIGGGVRLKVIEAMALGRPVIATAISKEGMVESDNCGIITANSPEEFYYSINYLLSSDSTWNNISISSRNYVYSHYDYKHNLNCFFND